MANRNKIEANTTIFCRLDSFCGNRNDPIANAGKPRWIETQEEDRDFLVHSQCMGKLSVSPSLVLAYFVYDTRSYFITAGFETINVPVDLIEEDLNGSILTSFLAEVEVRPSAVAVEIRQVVEVGEKGPHEYEGHDFQQMAALFPLIRVFSADLLDVEEYSGVFLLLCLEDRRRYEHWIDDDLTAALAEMENASATAIPYDLLCRAVLDIDPSSLFLALYRSLESLYAREQTMRLMAHIGGSRDWVQLAQLLEAHLGWHPREDTSLEALLQHTNDETLKVILSLFKEPVLANTNLQSLAAKRIYALRNALVHYRPFHRTMKLELIDWNRLCEVLSILVSDVYTATV